jgi:hypothetical protein
MWDAKVGMKVVCADDSRWIRNRIGVTLYPIAGHVYVIRAICENSFGPKKILLKLEEIPDQEIIYNNERCVLAWSIDKFRPLISSHKGMEVLRSILVNPKVKITGFEQKKIRRKVRS